MSILRANYSPDVTLLAEALGDFDTTKHPQLAAAIIFHDLMRGPWWFQFLVGWLRRKFRGEPAKLRATLLKLYSEHPDMASDLIWQTALHAQHGKDTEDRDSVGGFSQREMTLLLGEMGRLVQL